MIRVCPSCHSQRPVSEVSCGADVNGTPCGWHLLDVPVTAGGGMPLSAPAPAALPAPPAAAADSPPPAPPAAPPQVTVIEGWRLEEPLAPDSPTPQSRSVRRESDGCHACLTLHPGGVVREAGLPDALRRLPRGQVVEILATGQWQGRAFEVTEALDGDLSGFKVPADDPDTLRLIAAQLGRALDAWAACGLRHRDLRPSAVLIRSRDPLELAIGGLGSACLAASEPDSLSSTGVSRHAAPEILAGGAVAASDWWSLGMLLLDLVTGGACFAGMSDQTFLIHVLTEGAPLPPGLPAAVDRLLRGLLARDPHERWQWRQVRDWLDGREVPAPARMPAPAAPLPGPDLTLAGRAHRLPASFALAAADAACWEEARNLLVTGAIASWAQLLDLEPIRQARLREASRMPDIAEDLRLSLVLKVLNPAMPLVVRGEIVSPRWLLEHPAEGHELIAGPVPDFLMRMDTEGWLSRLAPRAQAVRERARTLDIALDEEALRICLVMTAQSRLAARWEARRLLFPDTDHSGLKILMDRRQPGEEDLIVLLAAGVGQFRPLAEVLRAAAKEAAAARATLTPFDPDAAREWLRRPRRELYQAIDERLARFARCGIPRVDEWADGFRIDRRMALPRVLALLAVPLARWQPLPQQDYIARLLDFFSRRITAGVLRGPLSRMSIGKTTARIDLTELGTPQLPATGILTQLLRRQPRVALDPAVFNDAPLERRLRKLHSDARLYRRDTGIDGLYLGFPFLLMRDPDSQTLPRIAPVLLWPVRIAAETGTRGQITLGFGRERAGGHEPEQVILNPAFEGLLGHEETARWQEAAQDLLTRDPLSLTEVMEAFGGLAAARGDSLARLPARDAQVSPGAPGLAPAAVLFHLNFMGQAIVKDLTVLKGQSPQGTGLATALHLVEGAMAPPAAAAPAAEADRYFTASHDPSQEEAVMAARQAPGLVVEGPPGTGKSQTIVNMVADAIGRGRSLLVICQKEAALTVVRKRLDREQLAERIMMVADPTEDRETVVALVREQVERLHTSEPDPSPAWEQQRQAVALRIEALEGELDRHHEALHRVDERTGLSYRRLLAELMALARQSPATLAAPGLRVPLSELHPREVEALEDRCAPLVRFWLPAGFEDSPLAVLRVFSPDPTSLDAFRTAFNRLLAAEASRVTVLGQTAGAARIADAGVLRVWLSRHEALFRSLPPDEARDLPRVFLHFQKDTASGEALLAQLTEAGEGLRALDAVLLGTPAARALRALSDVAFEQAAALATALQRTPSGLAVIGHWLARGRLIRLVKRLGLSPSVAGLDEFAAAAAVEGRFRPLRRLVEDIGRSVFAEATAADLGGLELAQRAVQLHSRLEAGRRLVATAGECPDAAAGLVRACGQAGADPGAALLADLARCLRREDARAVSLACLDALEPHLEDTLRAACLGAIGNDADPPAALSAVVEALPTLAAYQEFRFRAGQLPPAGVAVLRALRAHEAQLQELAPAALEEGVRHTIATEARLAWKARLEAQAPEVFLDTDLVTQKAAALARADEEMRSLNRERLRNGIDRSKVGPSREWAVITRAGKDGLRLREFIDQGIDLGLLALRPVWLMTPDTASRVLQLRPGLFDTVIYDEASQMPVEYALPTLFRSRVVVISGDEKQMPPTAFFSSRLESEEDPSGYEDGGEGPGEEADVYLTAWNRREIQSCPDLLHLGREVLPIHTLQVHYRSQYRELIAFSNAAFYGNRLSVPVRHPDEVIRSRQPVELIRSDGIYQDQSNPEEADDVVSYLARLWTAATPPSVGVVTFNRRQADIIEEAIETKAEEDPAFRRALARERERTQEGEDMRFFVKNVENVQGDERDVMVFSTTFGVDRQGSFRRNFGVLSQTGGERRLNVAVTRAREKVVLITSMPLEGISGMHTGAGAPRIPRDFLQAYMLYASHVSEGRMEEARRLLQRLPTEIPSGDGEPGAGRDGFSVEVEAFLRSEGWEPADARDGGAFGLDFAIADPRTGLYAIGIECDAPRHRILRTARAREVWRRSVLRHTVPHIHRVSCRAWLHSGAQERARLREAVRAAMPVEARVG